MIKHCEQCGIEFKAKGTTQKRCSKECYYKSLITTRVNIECVSCGKSKLVTKLLAEKSTGYCKDCFPVYCKTIAASRKKAEQKKAEIGVKKCILCSKEFNYRVNQKREKKYCSVDCSSKNSFKNITAEQRLKGIKSRSEGEKWSLYVESIKGEKNKRFTGNRNGRQNNMALKNWRKKVFQRDLYTCQKCNIKGGRLEAHHIKLYSKYPDLQTEVSNGITLCYDCHNKEHGKIKRPKTYHCAECKVKKNDGRHDRCRSCAGKKRLIDHPNTNPNQLYEKYQKNNGLTT